VVPALSIVTDRNGDISWVDANGTVEPLDIPRADNPRVTGDGSKVVAEVRGVGETQIWIHEIDSGSWTELETVSPATAPVWSNDGRSVFFMSRGPDGRAAIWRQAADFSSRPELVWTPEGHLPFPESTPDDGRFLMYSAGLPDQNDVWLLWLDGNHGAIPLTQTPDISEEGSQVHPSGRWFAYTSRESGRYEVYVRELAVDGTVGRRYAISPAGGAEPMWSRDGSTLFYRVGTRLLAVDVSTDGGFRVNATRIVLHEFPGDTPVLRSDYDVAADGRFITSIPLNQFSVSRLDVVVNWLAESGLLPTEAQR